MSMWMRGCVRVRRGEKREEEEDENKNHCFSRKKIFSFIPSPLRLSRYPTSADGQSDGQAKGPVQRHIRHHRLPTTAEHTPAGRLSPSFPRHLQALLEGLDTSAGVGRIQSQDNRWVLCSVCVELVYVR